MDPSLHEQPKPIGLHPDPTDPEYFSKVMENAAEDREEGESNPNFKVENKNN